MVRCRCPHDTIANLAGEAGVGLTHLMVWGAAQERRNNKPYAILPTARICEV
jgi:hypothetical protein